MNGSTLRGRLGEHWRLKAAMTLLLGNAIWFGYLGLQRVHLYPATVMTPTRLDAWLPFLSWTVYPYESLWVFMPLAPWLLRTRGELSRYASGLMAVCSVAFAFFLIHPTLCVRPNSSPTVNLLYEELVRIDCPLNAFPSLHATLALYHGMWLCRVLADAAAASWWRALVVTWMLVICLAALLTKQHVLNDLLAGGLLGWLGWAWFKPRLAAPPAA
jgi:PAP2 superfamily